MHKPEIKINYELNDVSETAFLTLYCHAFDAKSDLPILNDKSSIRTMDLLNKELSKSTKKLYKLLLNGNINKNLITLINIRAKQYDQYALNFIKQFPKATIVNIGCGLDNRFLRIDNGKIIFYDLDLPEIIEIKKQLFQETERFNYISKSVIDYSWIKDIVRNDILFLAEGVFMYLKEEDIKSLILKLQSSFSGSEIVCEVFNSFWLKGIFRRIFNLKMRKKLGLGKEAVFNFGIRDSKEMENWNKGIKFIDDWSYFDSNERKLGCLKILRNIELFRKTQWTVHYKLN